MSFSSDIKDKLCLEKLKCKNCAKAELSGFFEFSGRYEDGGAKFTTENDEVKKRLIKTLSDVFNYRADYKESARTSQFFLDSEKVIDAIGRWEEEAQDCCYNSYIRGAFLGSGSVTDPEKGYHLEFNTRYKIQAQKLCKILERDGINAKYTYRKGLYPVYIKESEKIAEVLGYMGASGGSFDVFSIQIEREMRNSINRRVNCENANADKTARAASKQSEAIKKIRAARKFSSLPETLTEIAKLREEYPELGLKELGEKANPPISKSGVNHRLNRLIKIAEDL